MKERRLLLAIALGVVVGADDQVTGLLRHANGLIAALHRDELGVRRVLQRLQQFPQIDTVELDLLKATPARKI